MIVCRTSFSTILGEKLFVQPKDSLGSQSNFKRTDNGLIFNGQDAWNVDDKEDAFDRLEKIDDLMETNERESKMTDFEREFLSFLEYSHVRFPRFEDTTEDIKIILAYVKKEFSYEKEKSNEDFRVHIF